MDKALEDQIRAIAREEMDKRETEQAKARHKGMMRALEVRREMGPLIPFGEWKPCQGADCPECSEDAQ